MTTPAEDGTDPTAIVPARSASRDWFDRRLRDFVGALATDEAGRPRSDVARQALAAVAHDMIARLSSPRASEEPDAAWPRDAALQPNQILANTFEVRTVLSSGGIGQVYRVRHRDLRTAHVVKVLQPRHVLDPTLTAMLVQEARLLARVRHRGVVGGLGLLRDGDGRLLLAMEHVRGCTLAARLAAGALPWPEVLALAHGLLAALGAIHEAGLLHNDLAPDNIILRDDSAADPVLIDFGLATALDEPADQGAIELEFAGKLSWISPERLAGPAGAADARSDLYAFGLVLAAASSGHRLAMGHDKPAAVAARQAVPALDTVPPRLRPIVAALLQPQPHRRPESHAAVADMLVDAASASGDGSDPAFKTFVQRLTDGIAARSRRSRAPLPRATFDAQDSPTDG